jgi:twitching motility protein PilT
MNNAPSVISPFLELTISRGGSDLHLASGEPPRVRIAGQLHRVKYRDLSVEDMDRIFEAVIPSESLRRDFERRRAIDFAFSVPGLGRFRVNASRHQRGSAAAFRSIPNHLRSLQILGLPGSVGSIISQPRGLTLVTGPTGSGKSTTLAAMIDHINASRKGHIICIEDPIEFVHQDKHCTITQREVGVHVPTFAEALRSALREDPDVVMVGEMRDLETISLALTAAETGIQVLGSLHTSGAIRTVDRIVHVFPPGRQEQVRNMLAASLRMVVSQHLVPGIENNVRHLAAEVLINVGPVGSLIRSGKANQLFSVMQSGTKYGMQLMDSQLEALHQRGLVSGVEAYRHAIDKTKFESFATRADLI